MLITNVTNLTKKSFLNYTGPIKTDFFSSKNIIFGYNGRGKSSLALGIIEEFEKNPINKKENYRYFDKNYIEDSILLKDSNSNTLKGVIANFGKKDVDSEKEIEKLKKEIIDSSIYTVKLAELISETKKEIGLVHDRKKGSSAIKKKQDNLSIGEIIELYKKDYSEAKKIASDEELIATKGNDDLENKLLNIQNINIPIINTLDDNIFDEVKLIFNKNYDNLEIPSTDIIEWLNKGLTLHDCKDECLFCGNKINIENIKKIVNEYNTNEKQKDSLKLMKFINILNLIMENYNEILNNIDTYSLALGKNIGDITNNMNNSKEIVQKSINILNEKASNITAKKELDLEIVKNEVSESSKISKTILEIKNKKIDEINNKINKLSSLIKGGIYLDIIQNTLIQTNIVKINENELLLKECDIKNKKINDRINALKITKSNTQDFASHINKILEGIEVNLKLELVEDNYIIKHTKENKILQIKDISEGEQNLLALLYFYYEIFEDENQTIMKNQIKLIILDDPITSMDDINKTYIIELIKHLFEFQKCQVFVFTHIWDDFCNICYGKNPKKDKEFMFYEIKKDVNGSKIVIANTSETPYQHGFKEIFELSQKPNSSVLDDCEIYHYPNTMRKVLEEFLSFKIKKSNPTSNNSENIKKVLSQKSWHNNDDVKLSTLLNVCNTLSHKFARNPDEIIKSARFLMNKIEEVDECHFNTMKQ